MLYKREIGVSVLPRREFLRSWIIARDQKLISLPRTDGHGAAAASSEPTGARMAPLPLTAADTGASGDSRGSAEVPGIDVQAAIREWQARKIAGGER
jgi:hypothetical protein